MSEKYFCKYCGITASSVSSLTAGHCPKYPSGTMKGFHIPYQGSEKTQYTCQYCGIKASSISSLTAGHCPKHPSGAMKGYHEPTL